MQRCTHCGSDNIRYSYSRITKQKGNQLIKAVYYCSDCKKECVVTQRVEMLPGFGGAEMKWGN